jgi:hypothetical protein
MTGHKAFDVEVNNKTASALYPVIFNINDGDYFADRVYIVKSSQERQFMDLPYTPSKNLSIFCSFSKDCPNAMLLG